MNNVKIKSVDGKTKVYVNDYELPDVTGVKFEQDVDTIPSFEIAVRSLPDFEVEGAVIMFSITSDLVVSALNVIRTAFSQDKELSKEILDSVCCLLAEIVEKEPERCALVKKGEILTGKIIEEKLNDEEQYFRTFLIDTAE